MQLQRILEDVRSYSGIQHKADISVIADALSTHSHPSGWHPNGDDAAAIPFSDHHESKGYTLMAIEGFINEFVQQDPWFAGWCGVMVNVSDIAAMGGRPQAVTNALWNDNSAHAQNILEGMQCASTAYGVPIIGGHTNLKNHNAQLAVAILGQAKQLLSSFAAQAGHNLVCAIDLRGSYRSPYLNWNAATHAPYDRLKTDIELLPQIAERELAVAAKDISQAGLLGTLLMLLECSNVGAQIHLNNIPKPQQVTWSDWLCSFPSFGFLLTTDSDKTDRLIECFHKRDIAAASIGEITHDQQLWVADEHENELFFDLSLTPLMKFKPSS